MSIFKSSFIFTVFASLILLGGSDIQTVIEGLPKRGDGAFLRTYPDGFRIFGVGSATIDDPNDAEAVLRAEKIANLNARKAISEFISQTISGETAISEAFKKAEYVENNEGTESKSSKKMTKESFAEEIRSETESIMHGVETIKITQIPKGDDVISRVLVGYSSKTLNALVQTEANAVDEGEAQVKKPEGGSVIEAPKEKAEEWLLCVGHGKDRKLAIHAAIIEGIEQVYGAYLENDETYKKRFEQLKSQNDGEHMEIQESSTEMTQETLTQTKGFIDAYRILSVEMVEAVIEAKIQAKFINPRVGGLKAIMVYPMEMPLSKQSKVYTIGPKKQMSGKELGSFCSRRLERAFTKANKYLILNIDDMAEAVRQHNLTKKLVDTELALPSELAKAGKLITADYIINTSFGDFSYSCKLGQNFKQIERVVFSFDYTLFEVKSGERRKQNTIKVTLDNKAIAAIRAEDEECTDEEMAVKIVEQAMSSAVRQLADDVKF